MVDIIERRWARRAHAGLLQELDTVVAFGTDRGLAAKSIPSISAWTVHQHLEHLWRADAAIVSWLKEVRDGTARTEGSGSTIAGALVMWLGMIPRGRGRAPKFTMPAGTELESIVAGLRAVRAEVAALGSALHRLASDGATRRHPLLGCYTPARWLRFAHIHHVHHRRIIEELRDL